MTERSEKEAIKAAINGVIKGAINKASMGDSSVLPARGRIEIRSPFDKATSPITRSS